MSSGLIFFIGVLILIYIFCQRKNEKSTRLLKETKNCEVISELKEPVNYKIIREFIQKYKREPSSSELQDLKKMLYSKKDKSKISNESLRIFINSELEKLDESKLLDEGCRLSREGKIEEAIKCYDRAISVNPKHVYAWYNKGNTLLNIGRYQEAMHCFNKVKNIDSKLYYQLYPKKDEARNLINISWELSLEGKYDEAIEYCGRAVSADPRYAGDAGRKISSIGYRLSDEGRYEEALNFWNKAILANPIYANDVATTLMNISWRLSDEGKYEEALNFCNKAILANPIYASSVATTLMDISWRLLDEGKHNDAKKFYNTAISYNQNCASAAAGKYFHEGCTLSNEGKYDEAIKYFDRATSINPNYKRAWSNKGNTYRKMGACSEAKICFEKVKAIDVQKREATRREIDNKLMKEKQNLEEKFKVILDKNPATLEEFVQSFLSTYIHNYPEHMNEFKRLLFLSQKRTSDEIEEAIKSYFTNIITREGMDETFHISESTYDFGLIYEFAKKYGAYFEKSDIEKLNKLLIQKGTRFHDIKLLEDLVICAVTKQNYEDFKKEMLASHPLNETQLIKQFIKVSKDDIDANMDIFFMLLLELEITNPSLVEIKMSDLTLEEFSELVSIKIFGLELISDTNERFTINDVDNMNGYEFENFIGSLYEKMGYSVEQTSKSGDQGADLIITKFGERTAVQTKNYRGNVSNKAIQEVVASQEFYKCNSCSVVTNSYFTKSAMELGNANGVKLVDRDELKVSIDKYM